MALNPVWCPLPRTIGVCPHESVQCFLSALASCGMWSRAHPLPWNLPCLLPHTHFGGFEWVIISSSLSQMIRGKISLKRLSFKYYSITCLLYLFNRGSWDHYFVDAALKKCNGVFSSFHNNLRFLKFWTHPPHLCLFKQHIFILSKQNSVSAMREHIWVFVFGDFFLIPQIFFYQL